MFIIFPLHAVENKLHKTIYLTNISKINNPQQEPITSTIAYLLENNVPAIQLTFNKSAILDPLQCKLWDLLLPPGNFYLINFACLPDADPVVTYLSFEFDTKKQRITPLRYLFFEVFFEEE